MSKAFGCEEEAKEAAAFAEGGSIGVNDFSIFRTEGALDGEALIEPAKPNGT